MAKDLSWQKWLRIREARIQIDALEIASVDTRVTRWRAEAFADRDGRLLEHEEVGTWVQRLQKPIPDPDWNDDKARLRCF